MEEVGERIRSIRRRKGLTLRKAAQAAGLAISTLSNMERGRHAISLTNLVKIAEALGIPATVLLPNHLEVLQQHVPVGHRLRFQYDGGIEAELLTAPGDPTGLSVFLLRFARPSETPLADPHRGWEYIYAIEGGVEVVIADRTERLEAGDFFCFCADRPHLIRARGPGRVLMVAFGTGWLPGRR